MFENAKVGQPVWSYTYGWGEITEIDKRLQREIEVKFPEGSKKQSYFSNGRFFKDAINQDLFYDEIKVEIPESAKSQKVEWEFPCYGKHKNGDIVYITSNQTGLTIFSENDENIGEVTFRRIEDFTPCTLEAKEIKNV